MPSTTSNAAGDPPVVEPASPGSLPELNDRQPATLSRLACWAPMENIDEPPVVSARSSEHYRQAGATLPQVPAGASSDAASALITAVDSAAVPLQPPVIHRRRTLRTWFTTLVFTWPTVTLATMWNIASLSVLLAVVAAIPIVQLVSLGYLLHAAANLSAGKPWRTALPGLRLVGRIAAYLMMAGLLWLPVWLVTDLAWSVQLLRPGTSQAVSWRVAAFLVAFAWLVWITWAAMRGGRLRHMLWPAPVRLVKVIWRPSTWSRAADDLWCLFERTQCISLWWLGLRAAAGALLWLVVPVSLMIIGLRAEEIKIAGLLGLIGALSLTWVMLYLPFLQILVAEKRQFQQIFNVREVRRRTRHAPWAMALALVFMLALSLPLYLLRIEATPEELTWLPSLFFVGLMLPAKLTMGAALGYGNRRPRPRHFLVRWPARWLALAASLAYVGALYIAQFIAWQGIYVMFFQHAVLVPVAS